MQLAPGDELTKTGESRGRGKVVDLPHPVLVALPPTLALAMGCSSQTATNSQNAFWRITSRLNGCGD